MGSYTNGVYVPALGEQGWGEEINDFLTRSGEEYVNVKQAPYGAKGDDSTNDTSAISAAITAAGIGGTVMFPRASYVTTGTLTPLEAQRWIFATGHSHWTNTTN